MGEFSRRYYYKIQTTVVRRVSKESLPEKGGSFVVAIRRQFTTTKA